MSEVLDPSGQRATPTNPNLHEVPCECGYKHQVEIFQARFYNMRQTSMVVAEHCGPFMCPGCLRLVTPCVVSIQTAIFVCHPLQSKEVLAGAPAETAEVPVALDPNRIM